MGAWWSTRDRTFFEKPCSPPLFGHGRHPLPFWCAALLVGQEIDEKDLERMAIHGDSPWQPEWELIVVSLDLCCSR